MAAGGAIEIAGLSKRFGAVQAVSDLSFEVEAGRVTGFLGPNGAGKSTTMRLILGLDTPNAGTASINGEPICGSRLRVVPAFCANGPSIGATPRRSPVPPLGRHVESESAL